MLRFKYKTILSSFFIFPLVLFAEADIANSIEEDTHASSHEMLIKPSYLEFDETEVDEITSQSESGNSSDIDVNPDFFANLQADSQNLPNLPPINLNNGDNTAQTWVPKFVWLGDIKQSDELKCFAAFLIGSLSNSDQAKGDKAPGVFMTPQANVATLPQRNNAVASNQLPPNSFQDSNNQMPVKSKDLLSRSTTPTTPPPEPIDSSFYTEVDFGVGFLLFGGLTGEFVPQPTNFFSNVANFNGSARPYSMRRRLESNATPIYTADFGFRMSKWMTFAATFQSQQGVHIRTKPTEYSTADGSQIAISHFESNLSLYSVGGKMVFEWPKMLRFHSWNLSLFLGGSCSGGWQSWTSVQGYQAFRITAQDYTSSTISFRDKTFANFVYTGDAGLIFKPSNMFAKSSFKLGCKFIGWGAARGLGNFKDQNDISPGTTRLYYFKPFRIKTVYSWSPYFGFNWNF